MIDRESRARRPLGLEERGQILRPKTKRKPCSGKSGTVFERGPSARENFFFGLKKKYATQKKKCQILENTLNTGKKRKKKGGIYPNDLLELRFTTFQVLFIVSCLQYMRTCPANGGEMPRQRGKKLGMGFFSGKKFFSQRKILDPVFENFPKKSRFRIWPGATIPLCILLPVLFSLSSGFAQKSAGKNEGKKGGGIHEKIL